MTDTYTAVKSAPDAFAPDLARQLGISERTVYRLRKRHQPPKIAKHVAKYPTWAQWVKRQGGDVCAVDAASAFGVGRDSIYHYRRTLIARRLIGPDDWPLRNGGLPRNKDAAVLMAMVRAGATPIQVAGAFRIGVSEAKRWIRETWVLIDLEKEKA